MVFLWFVAHLLPPALSLTHVLASIRMCGLPAGVHGGGGVHSGGQARANREAPTKGYCCWPNSRMTWAHKGPIWAHGPNMGPYGPNMGPCGPIWARMSPARAPPERRGPARTPPERRNPPEKTRFFCMHFYVKICVLVKYNGFSLYRFP